MYTDLGRNLIYETEIRFKFVYLDLDIEKEIKENPFSSLIVL